MKDLLGASFANNLNSFGGDQSYNLDNPDTKVRKGDRTQYSYDLLRKQYSLNTSTEIDFAKWNVVASVFSSFADSQRDGKFRHHLYEDSKGKSAVYNSFDAGVKGKLTYKINGKNFLVYNVAFFSVAPTLNEIFINPRATNLITPNVDNQIINSNDLSYILRGQVLKIRLSGYYTNIKNATEISRYYADVSPGQADEGNALVTEALTGLNKTYKGIELGAEIKITPTLSATAVGSYGDYRITNNPNVITSDDTTVKEFASLIRDF